MSGIILAIVLVVIVAAVAAVLVMRPGGRGRPNGRALRRRFGPEYDRLAEQHGDPKAAELELAARVRDREALSLRPLARDERERYSLTWMRVQERFVDDPLGAAQQADQVIGGLLTALGYPSQDRDRQLDLASVDHAHALVDYRQARDLTRREAGAAGNGNGADGDRGAGGGRGADSTEQLRQALLHYRVLFRELLDTSGSSVSSADSGAERVRVGH